MRWRQGLNAVLVNLMMSSSDVCGDESETNVGKDNTERERQWGMGSLREES
jgi:hypothetical protein